MFEIINNPDNVVADKETTRIKIMILNDREEMLLAYSHNAYQFVGGHLEENETLSQAVIREIKEETGIDLNHDQMNPFLVRTDYTKDNSDTGINHLSKIYYFAICINSKPDLKNTSYTEEEIAGDFVLRYVKLKNLDEELLRNIQNNETANVIINEMRQAIYVFEKYQKGVKHDNPISN